MPDPADLAQAQEGRMMEAHRHAEDRTSSPRQARGPAFCSCGEEMPTVRREYGYQDYVECAEARERKERGVLMDAKPKRNHRAEKCSFRFDSVKDIDERGGVLIAPEGKIWPAICDRFTKKVGDIMAEDKPA